MTPIQGRSPWPRPVLPYPYSAELGCHPDECNNTPIICCLVACVDLPYLTTKLTTTGLPRLSKCVKIPLFMIFVRVGLESQVRNLQRAPSLASTAHANFSKNQQQPDKINHETRVLASQPSHAFGPVKPALARIFPPRGRQLWIIYLLFAPRPSPCGPSTNVLA